MIIRKPAVALLAFISALAGMDGALAAEAARLHPPSQSGPAQLEEETLWTCVYRLHMDGSEAKLSVFASSATEAFAEVQAQIEDVGTVLSCGPFNP